MSKNTPAPTHVPIDEKAQQDIVEDVEQHAKEETTAAVVVTEADVGGKVG
jgi:hypothetical protein